MSTLALVGLGSNLGDRKATLDRAIAALRETSGVTVEEVSSYHETTPVGGPAGQSAFLNAAAAVETTLEPAAMLARLRRIEADSGRVRHERWAERTLDLDLLVFGDLVLDGPELSVPHPRMAVRRFVLAPLVEIVPDERDPITLQTFSELLANLDRRPSHVALLARDFPEVEAVTRGVAEALGVRPILRSGMIDDLDSLRRDVDRLRQALAAAVQGDPETWIVTGFAPGDECSRLLQRHAVARREGSTQDRAELDRAVRSLQAISREAPTPTFEVCIADGWGRTCALGAEAPFLLVPPGTDPTAMTVEIVAACVASRG